MYDEQDHRYTRRYGNIGCIAGLIVSGMISMMGSLGEPKLQIVLVAGVLLGAGIGMFLGRKRDKKEKAQREADMK